MPVFFLFLAGSWYIVAASGETGTALGSAPGIGLAW